VRIGRWYLRPPELTQYATRREDIIWCVGLFAVFGSVGLMLSGFIIDNVAVIVIGMITTLLGDTATTYAMVQGIQRRGRVNLADAAARHAECMERIAARRREINELADRVFSTPAGAVSPDVLRRLNELLDADWDDTDEDEDVR
jgi:hypothetical protein